MRTFRSERVASLIHKEMGNFLLREITPPEGTMITISGVEVSGDLSSAEIGISVLPESEREEVFNMLKKEQGRLQFLLNRKINIKPMPRINFVLDEGSEKAARIEKILLDEDNK
ncbi:MAG: 30S ribosome-binding factor RbfA [Patescibacteria group bacterium]|nr:30S ribosome-binding factor RbfA [Patescibacteria group bacterium]MDE2144765.1 30S ribosome-binding factor RbfA [Patescibacteria group bacterium]